MGYPWEKNDTFSRMRPGSFNTQIFKQPMGSPLAMGGGSPFGNDPVAGGGVQTPQGMDKVTMAMLLMNALGTGFQAYSQAQTAKKDREFQREKYGEGADVRAEGRRRLMEPTEEYAPPRDFFNSQQPLAGNVAAPPPPGASAERDEELKRILRARLGGQY
jgi:hypothetical protein